MNTYRWLSSCGIVFAAMLLPSCTQGQIEQVLQNKTQDMISGPCPPGSGPVSAAPEFCMYVTELRIVNHDTEADVSLTIVNRTGHRVYLAYSSSYPSLTDSSGTKWGHTKSTGIGFIGNTPLSLEPNVESQIAISFQRSESGQVPEGLTFSMRGELSILKADSRGELMPGNHRQAVRGVNFSGIRPMQQQLQSGGHTDQNQSTEFAQLSSVEAGLAAPKAPSPSDPSRSSTASQSSTNSAAAMVSASIAIDIVGLRLGMSPAEVEKVFKQRHLDNGILPSRPTNGSIGIGKTLKVFTFRDVATGQDIQIKDSEYVSSMRGIHDAGAQREEITVEFTPLHNREQAVLIWRQQYYSAGNQPAMDTFHKSLQDKYGSLRAKNGCDINGINCRYEWHYGQDGKPILNNSNECIGYNEYAGGRANIPDAENKFNKCGSIEVVAKVDGRDGLVNGVRINAYNRELDISAHKAANAITAAAEKERTDRQMQKARSQKPDF